MAVCAGEKGGGAEWHATPTQLQAANTPLHSMIISKRNYSAVCGLRLVGVAGRRGGVGGGGRRWLCWVVVWQTGSYAGHTPQPPWAAHSHPPSPHQPPLHTTPTHKCLGCSPYCVHQSAGGCRPAVAPCRWGGGVRGCSQGDWKASRWSWPGFWWPPVRCSQRVHGKTALPAPQPTRTTHTN